MNVHITALYAVVPLIDVTDSQPTPDDVDHALNAMLGYLETRMRRRSSDDNIMPYEGIISASRVNRVYENPAGRRWLMVEVYGGPVNALDSSVQLQVAVAGTQEETGPVIEGIRSTTSRFLMLTTRDLGRHSIDDAVLRETSGVKSLLEHLGIN